MGVLTRNYLYHSAIWSYVIIQTKEACKSFDCPSGCIDCEKKTWVSPGRWHSYQGKPVGQSCLSRFWFEEGASWKPSSRGTVQGGEKMRLAFLSYLINALLEVISNVWHLLQAEQLCPIWLHSIPHKGSGRCDADLNAWVVEQVSCSIIIICFTSY